MIDKNRKASRVAFGRILTRARLALGLSVREFAGHVGISYEYLRRIERGQGGPSRETVCAIISALLVGFRDIPTEVAREVLSIDFEEHDRARITELALKEKNEGLGYQESGAFDCYCYSALMLHLLHKSARGCIQSSVTMDVDAPRKQERASGCAGLVVSPPAIPHHPFRKDGEDEHDQQSPRNGDARGEFGFAGALALARLPHQRVGGPPASGVVLRAGPPLVSGSAPPRRRSLLSHAHLFASAAVVLLTLGAHAIASMRPEVVASAVPFIPQLHVETTTSLPERTQSTARSQPVAPPVQQPRRNIVKPSRALCDVIACGRDAEK